MDKKHKIGRKYLFGIIFIILFLNYIFAYVGGTQNDQNLIAVSLALSMLVVVLIMFARG